MFSPDGTRIAFRRANLLGGSPAEDIVVVERRRDQARGDHRRADPVKGGAGRFEWAPDSRTLLVNAPG